MFFNLFIPLLTSNSDVSEGVYRFVFKDVKSFSILPDWKDKEINIEGRNIKVVSTEKDFANNKYKMTLQISKSSVSEAKISTNAVAMGIIALLGVGLLFMSFEKVEKLLTNPVMEIGIVAVFGIVLVKLMKSFRR